MTERFIKFKKLELKDCTITVQIEDVVWGTYKDYKGNEVDIQRGNCKYIILKENFNIWTCTYPELRLDGLAVFGDNYVKDNNVVSYEYVTKENAQEAFNLLKSIAIEEPKVITDVESFPMPAIIEESNKHWQSFTDAWSELYNKAEKIKTVSDLNKLTNKIKDI